MTKNLSIKSVLMAILLGISFLFLPCMMLSTTDHTPALAVVSTTSLDDTSSVGLSNPNFTSTSGSSTSLQTPSNWTKVNGNGNEPAYKGVADLSSSSFNNNKKNYGLDFYNLDSTFVRDPSSSSTDSKVLLINAQNQATNYGYTNSSNFTLEANSFYEIKMFVYTYSSENLNTFASVALTGDDFKSTKITNINTLGSWKIASIFVTTNANKTSTAKLELFLGEKNNGNSAGFVCFDNISVMRYSKAQYDLQKTICENNYYVETNLNTNAPIVSGAGFIENGNFASNLTGWENDGVIYVSNFDEAILINGELKTINSNQRGDTRGALLSASNSFSSLKSSEFTVGRMKMYQISFWAKSAIASGEGKLEIVGIPNAESALTPEEKSASITNLSNGSSLNNYWAKYDFFITGDSRFDTTAYLKFTLGSSASNATGYIAIANIQSFEITNSDKETASSTNSNSASLTMENSPSLNFANSTFNLVTIEKGTLPSPNNWTTLNTTNKESGVVNVKQENWNNEAPICPNKENNYSDNVLMIHNSITNSYQAYTSETVNVASEAYVSLSFEAYTYQTNGTVFAVVTDSNSNVIYKFEVNSPNKWTTYSLAFQNYMHDLDIQLTLYLGDNENSSTGYAFFDNCTVDTGLTEDSYNQITASENVVKLNLGSEQITANDNGTPRYLSASIENNTQYGVVKAQDFNLGVSKESLNGPTNAEDEILYIYSPTPTYSTLTSNFSYNFDADTYYKVSVKVKTIGIDKTENYRFDTNGNEVKYGATFMVSNIDKYFTGINTRQNDKDLSIKQQFEETSNEWVEYILYINVEESVTSNIVFGLGNSEIKAAGYVFFADFNVKSITEDEYKSQTATYENELPFNVLLATPDDEEEENTEPTNFDSAAWFAIPTAIIAVAVLVAIFGYFVRKFKNEKPKKEKVADADYDRLHTLLKDVDKKERKTEIKHKITLLREELKLSEKYLAEETEELNKRRSGEITESQEGASISQLEKSIQTQKDKIAEIELDIKVLENEYQKIVNKQK